MDFRHIRAFIAVADALSVTKAAERLHISQPPLSRHIQQLENELGLTLFVRHRQGVTLTEPGRQLLEKVVGERFDYEEMSRRSLGAPWNNLSDKEKQEFVSLFQTLLVNTYADKIESYTGQGVHYLNERREKEYAEVRTKVLTGKTEIPLDYRLLNKDSGWRVYDVVVDGVSLVNNYRGQFSKILRNGSYADLVDQLRKKSDKIKSP